MNDIPFQVGDIVTRRPITLDTVKSSGQMRGKVVYIHPEDRFHVVEFGDGQWTLRESFIGVSQ